MDQERIAACLASTPIYSVWDDAADMNYDGKQRTNCDEEWQEDDEKEGEE